MYIYFSSCDVFENGCIYIYIYIYIYNFKFLVWNGFQRALNFLGAVLNYSKRFQASKVFHRFNATGLFRIVNG